MKNAAFQSRVDPGDSGRMRRKDRKPPAERNRLNKTKNVWKGSVI